MPDGEDRIVDETKKERRKRLEEQVGRAVEGRIDGFLKDGQLSKAYKNISGAKSSGSLLRIDKDVSRECLYIKSKTGVSDTVAEMIRIGADLAKIKEEGKLTESQYSRVALFVGQYSKQYFGVEFLALARAAADPVARIVKNGSALGTGFMISEKLFLTNNHVVNSKDSCSDVRAEFNYENDYRGEPKSVSKFHFEPDTFFITSLSNILDYTLVAIGDRVIEGVDNPGEVKELKHFGYCPLGNNGQFVGDFANVIQHPLGGSKQIALRENQLLLDPDIVDPGIAPDNVYIYDADTNEQSSGSPVFDDDFKPVALHHWGKRQVIVDGDSKSLNEGIKISAIVNDLRKRRMAGEEGIKEAKWKWLDDALDIADEKPLPSNIYNS